MTIPITKRVNDSRSKDLPVNQEVTKNSDGSGGPVDLPGGSPLKQVESYDKNGYPITATDDKNKPIVKEIVPYKLPYLRKEVIAMINYLKNK